MAGRLTRELMQNSAGGMRHFALVGYRFEIDTGFATNRRYWAEQFGTYVIYYPVKKRDNGWVDHSALTTLLKAIRQTCTCSCALPLPSISFERRLLT